MSNAMLEFTKSCGVERQHTVRARPQQNGVAERANRVLPERIMAMLKESGLAMAFWGEVLAALIHVWNHCPTAALDNATESGPAMAFWGEVLAALIHVWNHCPTAALDNATPCTSCGMDANQMLHTSESGDALPMSVYRRTSVLRCTITMRSASSSDTQWKFYNPTTVISERADFDERPSAATITPNVVPAVPYTAPDMLGNDDEDGLPAAPEMLLRGSQMTKTPRNQHLFHQHHFHLLLRHQHLHEHPVLLVLGLDCLPELVSRLANGGN